MAELEDQLRAYADQVEGSVGETPADVPTRRRPWWLAAAAALLLVVAVGGFALLRDDSADPDLEIESVDQPVDSTTTTTTSLAVVVPDVSMPTPEVDFGPGPLSERHDTLVFRTPTEVIVWGGDVEPFNIGRPDLAAAVFNDGAIFTPAADGSTGTWRAMAPSPLPAVDRRPVAAALDGSDQPEILVVRGTAAAVYDTANDSWQSLDALSSEIRELLPAPELSSIFAVTEVGVMRFDLDDRVWSDTGAFAEWDVAEHELFPSDSDPAPSVVWTGDELVAVAGAIDGVFAIQTWAPGGEWSAAGHLDSGVSEVAVDTAWVEDEVWVVGYAMTVHAWDPSTRATRVLPSLPVIFQEGVPEISSLADGRVVVERWPGMAVWNGDGWEVEPSRPEFRGTIAPGLDGRPAVWSYELGRETGAGNSLRVAALPRAGELRTVLVGTTVIELVPGETLVRMTGTRDDSRGEMEIWAQIDDEQPELGCSFWTIGGPSVDVQMMLFGDRGLSYACGGGGIGTFAGRITDYWNPDVEPSFETVEELIVVPSVEGLFFDEMQQLLADVGLEADVQFQTVPSDDPQVGVVIGQVPPASSLVPPGASVTVIVGEAGAAPE